MRHGRLAVVVAALAAAWAGCAGRAPRAAGDAASPPGSARYRLEDAPAALAPAIARADAAIRALRDRLAARVQAEMSRAGPRVALDACRSAGPGLAPDVSAQTGVAVGRTSAHPRASGDAPRRWAIAAVEETAGRRAADAQPVVVDLGDRVGVLRPIAVVASCVACHGGPERVTAEVQSAIDEGHASSPATAWAEGDLAGYFWAEAKK